jgi:vitamin B12 transporter
VRRSRAVISLLAVTAIVSARAQSSGAGTAPIALDPFITTATRTPAAPETIGSAVTTLSSADLARQQITSLSDALATTAGAPDMSSGAPGSVTALYLRGSNSKHTLFLVDGLRLNDPNTDYLAFLGGASLSPNERIDVVRGPQSTLYGSDAIGGVIAVSQLKGSGAPTAFASAEVGSFGTRSATLAGQGSAGANSWNASANAGRTDNDRPANAFEFANVSVRLDRQLTAAAAVGATLRYFHGRLQLPGDRFTNDPNDRNTEDNVLATAFADLKLAPNWNAHVILGGQDRRFVNETPAPNPPYFSPAASNVIVNRRGVLDAQTTFTGFERHRVTAGTTGELHQTRNNGFGAIDHHQDLLALFVQDEVSVTDALFATAGLRSDWFDTFGRVTTGRAALAWVAIPRTLKLRASYGTGFRAPSFLDLYGQDRYYVGNQNLDPERARGIDAGVDYYLPESRGVLSATWFQTDFTNLIDYDFMVFPSTAVNVGRARTRGVEVSARIELPAQFGASLSYTFLDAQALAATGHTRLLRRPRHQFSADLHRDFGAGLTGGAGVLYVGRRADVDASTFLTVTDPDLATVRVYAAWQATSRLALKARLENALNRRYELVNGYPARRFGAFASVEYRF